MDQYLRGEDFLPPEEDDIPLGDESLPPDARRVPPKLRRLVRNAHCNLGHPGNDALVRLMTLARCHKDLIIYAKHLKCPTCLSRKQPDKIPWAAMPYRHHRFNACIGMGIKYFKDCKGAIPSVEYFRLCDMHQFVNCVA